MREGEDKPADEARPSHAEGASDAKAGRMGTVLSELERLREERDRLRSRYADMEQKVAGLENDLDRHARALLSQRRINALVLDSVADGIAGMDLHGRFVFANAAAARMLGREIEDVHGFGHALFHHTRADGRPYPLQECPVYRTTQDGQVHVGSPDEVYWRKDGTSFPVELISTPMTEEGRVTGAVVVFRDVTERLAAEARLKESEERSRRIIEMTFGLAAYYHEGKLLHVNDAGGRLMGYEPAQMVGRSIMEFVAPTSKPVVEHRLQLLRQTGFAQPMDVQLLAADGHLVDVEMASLATTYDGKPANLLIARDIAPRKRIEAAFKASEERFRSFMAHSPILAWIKDSQGRYLFTNPAYHRFWGTSPEQVDGHDDSRWLPPDVMTHMREVEDEVLRTGEPRETIRWYDTPHGRRQGYTVRFRMVDDAGPRELGAVGLDLTDLAEARGALRASEERFRQFMDHDPALAYIKDTEGRFVYANAAFAAFLGMPPAVLIGLPDTLVLPDAVVDLVHEADARVIATGESHTGPLNIPRADGQPRELLAFKFRFHDAEGKPLVGGLSVDVTEFRQAQAELAARNERLVELSLMRNQFFNAVSHELRTPLTVIQGNVELLDDAMAPPEGQAHHPYVEPVLDGVRRLARVLDDLLDLGRIEAGNFKLQPEALDLAEQLVLAVQTLEVTARSAGVRLDVERPDHLVVVADPMRLDQVIGNLVGNAIKFSPEGANVEVRLRLAGDRARVEVQDHGPGIAPEDVPRLFKPFSQLAAGTSKKGGTGLGLSIAKSIVEAHGGRIGVDSVPGEGCTFWFEVPIGGG